METTNIKLSREQRILIWNLIGAEVFKLEAKEQTNDYHFETIKNDKLKKLKELEILIIG